MIKILLLDCSESLQKKLQAEGFDVEAGTAGPSTGVRKLPSQVYEKTVFFYDPRTLSGSGTFKNETPHFDLAKLESHILRGATLVAFLNPIPYASVLYGWVPFMPALFPTHDKDVFVNQCESYPQYEQKQLAPVVTVDNLSLPVQLGIKAPKPNPQFYKPDVYKLFWNGNGDTLGVELLRGNGRLILLPIFKSNDDVIETFLHRVVPELYDVKSHSVLTDLFTSPAEVEAATYLDKLSDAEKEIRRLQEETRVQLAAATREKLNVIAKDEVAKQVQIYYDLARRQDDAALFYLYKAVEVIENKLGGEREAIKTLGKQTEWKAVKRLANESYRDARHAPKPTDVIKKWTHAEIEECFKNVENIATAYFSTLFAATTEKPAQNP